MWWTTDLSYAQTYFGPSVWTAKIPPAALLARMDIFRWPEYVVDLPADIKVKAVE